MPSLATTAILLAAAGLSAAAPATMAKRGPTCSEVKLSVTVSAENHVVPQYLIDGLSATSLTVSGVESLINGVGNELELAVVNGTYNIAGLFCEPEVQVAGRSNNVQLLVHGIGNDRHYWTGGVGAVERYSWIAHASKQGYPTLAIDRLGDGKSDRPDPITVVQKPVHVEIVHQVAQALRAGTIAGVGRAFSRVAYVGHSFGSLIGNTMAARYPDDFDAMLLTGYTSEIKQAIPGFLVTSGGAPAALVDPARFAFLASQPGYQLMSFESGVRGLVFTNTPSEWDAAIVKSEFKNRQTLTLGEAVSTLFVNDVAESFTKPLLVLTGHKDQFFCALALPLLGEGNCSGYGAKTAKLFPKANYRFQEIANTGHALNFHYTSNETFTAAHDFLKSAGF
ncbi:alpha beta-hydrolase [Diplodia corticola]|uniref:Alpha beta-hydrolase n=1 Tax=Diplodia corticola TaxID=236234 RepID=A0A1J9RU24_9PEZI|nr:alpha beta-hydrolase [Diplodia corticola]OJD31927.1 alpha beta-hydrolase [Diplodia corticola]